MVKQLPLTRDKVALVDDDDYEAVKQFKWFALRDDKKDGREMFYAVRSVGSKVDGKWKNKMFYLHRDLMPGVKQIDHIDGDGLNNQRSNIRPATKSQNAANRKNLSTTASSRFRGVSWFKPTKRWRACIKVNQKYISLGYFLSEEDAARAYDDAARLHFGEFASPNFG